MVLTDYIHAAVRQVEYRMLPDDGRFFGDIPALDGVWANADTLEACREELEEVLEEWIVLRLSHSLPLPVIDGHSLALEKVL